MSHLVFYEKIFAQNWTFYETNETVDKKNGWSLSIFSKSLAGKELNIFVYFVNIK